MEKDDFEDLDDGATEAHPLRRPKVGKSLGEAAQAPSGGKLAEVRHLGKDTRRNSISLRSPHGAAQIAFEHLPILKALWRLHSLKRSRGEPDGVKVKEVADDCGVPTTKIQTVLTTLRKNGVVRSVQQYQGYSDVTAFHFPTEMGMQLLALGEFLGPGASVTVGGMPNGWAARSRTEPESFFRHLDLLRGVRAKQTKEGE